ncbi:GNAT family N-acetyltransferase [Paenibacillus sp. CAA11]|uniref:GNAT family N-acetyltransferase n=1 Tax=Paenibacillus sp. CAA11 TaxID=1532905 RepID=UPI000D372BE5|nr:GNAT family N-acetyltransferase [Paenibacillus sp. CAA11]AWB45250.1 GNAT family N-acetyltransferase [Paenibacillus sp. CAA11]
MSKELTIQEFSQSNQDGVLNLILHIQQVEYDVPITKDDQPDLLDIPGVYQQGIGNFWIALVEGVVVGTIALLDIGRGNLALRKMFVAQEYRGSKWNTGALLLKHAVNWAESKNIENIYLGTTLQFKAAHRFYEKNNFKEISEEALPTEFPIMPVDKKFYHLSIGVSRRHSS